MNYLIDSHVLVWHKNTDDRMSRRAIAALEDPSCNLHISQAVFWELAIKQSMRKLDLRGGLEKLHEEWIQKEVADLLPIQWTHLQRLMLLPWLHRDPFDRMLVAQALTHDLTLITSDPHIPKYPGVKVLW